MMSLPCFCFVPVTYTRTPSRLWEAQRSERPRSIAKQCLIYRMALPGLILVCPARVLLLCMQSVFQLAQGCIRLYTNEAQDLSLICLAIAPFWMLQVVDFTFEGGIVELCIGEAVVKDIQLQFIEQKTGTVKEEGATKPEIITRHLTTKPGRVYNLRAAKADIDSIYSTGLFEDVNIVPKEAEESTEISPKVRASMRSCRVRYERHF